MLYDIKVLLEELDISDKEKEDLVKEVREEFLRMRCYLNYTYFEHSII